MVAHDHCDCGKSAVEKMATLKAPYHFVDSGLPNVYLVGIGYLLCKQCKRQSAEIPFLKDLLIKIARAVVMQETPLDHFEIRFLRKRLGKKSAEFAGIIGVTPEHLSRLESSNEKFNASPSVDRLIRVYYSLLSGDETLKDTMNSHIDAYMATLRGEEQTSSFRAELHDREWEAEPIPA